MVNRTKYFGIFYVAAAIAALSILSGGCGKSGGGGRSSAPAAPVSATGYGKVAAVVKLTPPAGRIADANGAATVTVSISISGVYGPDHKEFKPVTTTVTLNIAAGPAKVSMLDVPIGVNHLLTVVADWGGATDTVKTIIPEVKVGETATAVANQASTVVADAALLSARQRGKALYEISPDEIMNIQMTVELMAASGIPYSLMAPDKVLGFMKNMGAPAGIMITPATATVIVGGPLQFMALVMDANGLPVPGATATWAFSAPAVGNISQAGLFTGSASGTGVITASFATLTATAPVTVITVCASDSSCNDNNPLTVDLCQNPGALNAQCVHNAIACAVDADCDDNNPQTTDTCAGGGAAGASCSHTQIVNQPPTASATADVVSGIAPLTVNFTGGCSDPDGTCASYQWNFGDGSATDTAQNPSHIYTASGTFTATLIVTDNQGATALNTAQITVTGNQTPTGNISANVTNGIAPLGVNFTGGCADADGTCVSYLWDFGDGSPTNSSQSPGHTYTATGTFTVTLTVTDNLGASTQQTLSITPTAANQPPTAASVNASPAGGAPPLLVNFSAACSDPDGACVSYLWDFGDGATSPLQTPGHTYTATGTFNALLTVTDNSGGTATGSVTVTVSAANIPPAASASANVVSGIAPMAVNFTGGCSDPDGTCASYAWNFGDGGATDTTQNPSHTFTATGSFNVVLAVTDNLGATAQSVINISVGTNQLPAGTINASPATGTAPLPVNFTGNCSDPDGTCVSYMWNFGDGSPTVSAQNPSHTYATGGAFTVTLTVTDNLGAATNTTTIINVNNAPVASASSNIASGISPLAVSFTGGCVDSDGTCASYYWDFGDGATSTIQNSSHTYIATGTFNAVLSVKDNLNATATSAVSITVVANQPPVASATSNFVSGIAPLAVNFTGGCADPDGACVAYSWNFGDGGATDTTQNPSHTYSATGTFNATLTITDNLGLTAQSVLTINVAANQKPAGSISSNVTTGTAPLGVNFTGGCTDPDGTCASYMWDFGDGAPTVSTQNTSHTYNTPGTFVVTFTVTDNNGASSFSTASISVAPAAVCGNNIPEPGEECDDGNAANGDGCSQYCMSEIAVSMEHVCAINRAYDGGVECWGRNHMGQLGDGTTTNRSVPTAVPGLTSGVKQVVAGNSFACALTTAGGVKCWGLNANGELGIGNVTNQMTPMDVTGLASGVKQISAGTAHVCAVMSAGGVKCWGLNNYGQIGNGGGPDVTTPVDAVGVTNAAYVAAGENFTCVLSTAGGVKCWGRGNIGSLGAGDWNGSTVPVNVLGLTTGVAMISTGSVSSQAICALTTAGGVKCWGENLNGGIGDGTTVDKNSPTDVTGLTSGMKGLGIGYLQSCGITTAGAAKCWGNNAYGTLGDGTYTHSAVPVNVAFASGAFGIIRASRTLTGARATSGEIYLWGDNSFGQYGNGTTAASNVPVTFAVSKFSTNGTTTCVVTGGGGLMCWGDNAFGQLGDGTTTNRATPAFVSGLSSGVLDVSVGTNNGPVCALTAAGALLCWGNNAYGELGNGTLTASAIPVSVTGLGSGVSAFETGFSHSCALTAGGGLKCWGYNYYGELGDGTGTDRTTPVDVTGFTAGVAKTSGRAWHNCMVTAGGGVKCWGEGYGVTPVDVTGLASGVVDVKAGYNSDCALMATGGVKCWGNNGSGQLGDGTNTNSIGVPVNVVGLSSGVVSITMTWRQACALTNTGGVKCWGENANGQLGNGTTANSNVPVDVTGLTSGVKAIYIGGSSPGAATCAAQGGVLKCWGYNFYGQLGDGTTTQRLTPVNVLGF